MWWYKPQGIDEPSLIQGEGMEKLCAMMCMLSSIGRDRTPDYVFHNGFYRGLANWTKFTTVERPLVFEVEKFQPILFSPIFQKDITAVVENL